MAAVDGLVSWKESTDNAVILSFESIKKLEAKTDALSETDNRISKHADTIRDLNLDVLRLVDFAVDQATVSMLHDLIASAPRVRPDPELDDVTCAEHGEYVRRIRSKFAGTYRGSLAVEVLALAEKDAEQAIEETPQEQRLPVDPLRFRRWSIANNQVREIVLFLARQKRESDRKS